MALTIAWEGKGIIAYCDDLSDLAGGTWTEVGGGSIEQATDAYLVGSACIGGAYSNKTGRQQYQLASTLDFDTGGNEEGQFLYIWIQTSTIYLHESIANGGLTVCFGTSAGSDFRTFMIAAGDDTNGWTGDWKCFVIDPSLPGTVADSGSFDLGNINYIWVDLDITALAKGNNILIDMLSVGKGLRITGTSTTPWADLVTYCNDFSNRAWGAVQEREDIIYVYGKLWWGSSSQGAAASFVETSAPVVKFGISEYYYSASWVLSHPEDYSGIIVEDASGYITTFDDGIIVGTDNGRAGSTFIGHDDLEVSVDLFGGNNANSLTRLYGTNFRNLIGGITWGDDDGHLFYGGVVYECGQFDPVGSPSIRNVIFASTKDEYTPGQPDGAALLWNDDIDIEDCKFIANTHATYDPHAIEHPISGEKNYVDLEFPGNDYDILYTSSGELQINASGVSDPTSYEDLAGDGVSIISTKIHTLTGIQEGSEVTYVSGEGLSGIVLKHVENVDGSYSGEVSYQYNYAGDFAVDILVMHLDFEQLVIEDLILGSENATLPISQVEDRVYINP
jgi:hypothetical protein